VLRLALSDITERKQAEVERRENHEILRGILETTLDGYWRTDGQGHLVDVNAAYCKQSGYTREELLQMRISDLEAKESQADTAEHIRHIIASGSDQFESMHRRKDGSVWHVEVSTTFRDIAGGEFFVFLRDITERKRVTAELERHRNRLEELVASRTHELEQAKAAAEKADNAKSRFLAAASHDLRQPLSALSLFVSVLRNTLPPGSGELVGSIQDCVDSLSELLTDLLDVSKLDAGVVTPKLSDFAVDDVLATLVSIHSAEAELKGLRLRLRRSGIVVRTDQQLLHRILGNLVTNAIRYTDRGGMLIACRRRNGRHWVEVWDSGVGISGDKTGIIFEEFRQLGDDARHRGSGLGLSIVAKTAALLGLRIRLTSRPGRGSMFAVELPAETGSGLQDALPSQPTARALRIGLVEDHARVLEALVLALEGVGHRVIAAATGQALIERLGDQAPDIVISDYRLAAAETGFDVIAAVRATFDRELPAVLITGDTDPALVRSMADRGIAVHYKPLQIEALQAFIGHATERRRRER
jgi:PAS domain S-box-containing protein